MAARRRVVVTGLGAVTPIGSGRDGLMAGLKSCVSAVRRVTTFDSSPFSTHIAAEVSGFDAAEHMDRKRARRLDRFSQFALAAARQAIDDAGLEIGRHDRDRVGCFIGSALGGAMFGEEQTRVFLEKGIKRVKASLALSVFVGAAPCNIAMEFGITGPTSGNSNSCTSGAIAIGDSFRLIREGHADVMLAGGAEAPLSPLIFGSFANIRAMSTRNDVPHLACRPFDRERDGFVMAEGAAVLVLEEVGHALHRDAPIYGEVLGYGTTNDGYHMIAPLPSGHQAARAMRCALEEAGLAPEQVGYVNAHASSTLLNDAAETAAIKLALGAHAARIPVSGTKSMHAHALGASGAIEAAICMLVLRHNYLPPTVNLHTPDPRCDLDYVPNIGRAAEVDYILSNSFGFGGINATLAFGRLTT